MRRIITTIGFLFCTLFAFAHTESMGPLSFEASPQRLPTTDTTRGGVDYRWIERFVKDSPSSYEEMLDRFVKADTTLSYNEILILYYGFVYTDKYKPMGDANDMRLYSDLLKKGKLKKALKIKEKELATRPVSLSALYECISLESRLNNNSEELDKLCFRYLAIASIIESSGDGTSGKRGYCVNWVADEYGFVNYLFRGKAQVKSQTLVSDNKYVCDKLKLVVRNEETHGEDLSLYFDITEYYKKLNKLYSSIEDARSKENLHPSSK